MITKLVRDAQYQGRQEFAVAASNILYHGAVFRMCQ